MSGTPKKDWRYRWADSNTTFGTMEDPENMNTLELAPPHGPKPRIVLRSDETNLILDAEFWDDGGCKEFIIDALNGHLDLVEAERLGHALSTWAASIHWGPNSTNTKGWLEGLRERIEAVQAHRTAMVKAGRLKL